MIIATHAVVGAVSAQAIAPGYVSAFAVGFLTHFIMDAIPHWDYPLHMSMNPEKVSFKTIFKDGLKLFLDFTVGILIIFFFIYLPLQNSMDNFGVVLWFGALGAILPDVLQNLADFKNFKFLSFFKTLHNKIHAKLEFKNPWCLLYQVLIVILAISLALYI